MFLKKSFKSGSSNDLKILLTNGTDFTLTGLSVHATVFDLKQQIEAMKGFKID